MEMDLMALKRSRVRNESGFISLKSGLLMGGVSAAALGFGVAAFAGAIPTVGASSLVSVNGDNICVTAAYINEPQFNAKRGLCGPESPKDPSVDENEEIIDENGGLEEGVSVPGSGNIIDTWTSNDGQRILVVRNGSNILQQSQDGGSTWSQITLDKNPFHIDASEDGQTILAGRSGFNTVSRDGGETWIEVMSIPDPDSAVGFTKVSADGSTMVIADNKSTWDIFVSRDFGNTWTKTRFKTPPSGPQIVMNYISNIGISDNGKTIIVATMYEYSVSHDGGLTWLPKITPDFHFGYGVEERHDAEVGLTELSADGETVFSTMYSVGALSNDGGRTWDKVISSPDKYFTSVHISSNGNELMATTDSKVYRSIDKGASWVSAPLPAVMRDSQFSPNGEYLTSRSLNDKLFVTSMLTEEFNWTAYTAM
jgi:photosystem II stability/assembly factor-like uncharacterized protein